MSNTEKIPYKIYLDEKEMPKQWYNAVSYTHLTLPTNSLV